MNLAAYGMRLRQTLRKMLLNIRVYIAGRVLVKGGTPVGEVTEKGHRNNQIIRFQLTDRLFG